MKKAVKEFNPSKVIAESLLLRQIVLTGIWKWTVGFNCYAENLSYKRCVLTTVVQCVKTKNYHHKLKTKNYNCKNGNCCNYQSCRFLTITVKHSTIGLHETVNWITGTKFRNVAGPRLPWSGIGRSEVRCFTVQSQYLNHKAKSRLRF